MDQSLENTNIKTEPTNLSSIEQVKIPTGMKSNFLEKKNDCLVQSDIHIKTEPEDDKNEFPAVPSTSSQLCSNYDMAIETDEPMIKIEFEDMVEELTQDPLDVGREIKVENPTPNLNGERNYKSGQTEEEAEEEEEEEEEYISTSDDEESFVQNYELRKVRKHICSICTRDFGDKETLNRHLRIHTGEKPYACDICNKSFTQKGNLNIHMLIHSGEKPHVCNVCQKVFRYKSNLNHHMLIHNGKKPFSCDVCNKPFAQKSNLVVHKRIHTGEKPYACEMCVKTFVHKSDLTRHTRTHTGEKPYACNICNKLFTYNADFNRHKRNYRH